MWRPRRPARGPSRRTWAVGERYLDFDVPPREWVVTDVFQGPCMLLAGERDADRTARVIVRLYCDAIGYWIVGRCDDPRLVAMRKVAA